GFLVACGFEQDGIDYEMEALIDNIEPIAIDGIKIAEWTEADTKTAEALAKLYNVYLTRLGGMPEVTADGLLERCARKSHRFMIAKHTGSQDVVGLLTFLDDYFVTATAVQRRYWGKRVADALVMELKRVARDAGQTHLKSLVSATNAASLRLHRDVGAQCTRSLYRYKRPC
ncbi:MAG: GNAT family N-acetyltransferase, partial [Pseudomonadota bacterium]